MGREDRICEVATMLCTVGSGAPSDRRFPVLGRELYLRFRMLGHVPGRAAL